jgi:hypothetical protein
MRRAIFALAILVGWLTACTGTRADELQTLQTLRTMMYVGEGMDCLNSGVVGRHGGIELNPFLKLGSHGGPVMFCGYVAAWDLVSGAFARRWPVRLKQGAAAFQVGSNYYGIRVTIKNTGW